MAKIPPAPSPATSPVTASWASAETGIPTRSETIIPLTAAPGARGCSDRNASAMNTNGITARPNAMNGAAAGASAASDAAPTMPAMIAQNAGASTSVASRIARHFFRGDSGATPAGGD